MTALTKNYLSAMLLVWFLSAAAPHAEQKQIQRVETTAGVFFGYVHFLDPQKQVLVVTPIDSRLPRKRFMLDRQTKYQREGKPASISEVTLGSKVAVRYFADGMVTIGDSVFLVPGEFHPLEYRFKKNVRTP